MAFGDVADAEEGGAAGRIAAEFDVFDDPAVADFAEALDFHAADALIFFVEAVGAEEHADAGVDPEAGPGELNAVVGGSGEVDDEAATATDGFGSDDFAAAPPKEGEAEVDPTEVGVEDRTVEGWYGGGDEGVAGEEPVVGLAVLGPGYGEVGEGFAEAVAEGVVGGGDGGPPVEFHFDLIAAFGAAAAVADDEVGVDDEGDVGELGDDVIEFGLGGAGEGAFEGGGGEGKGKDEEQQGKMTLRGVGARGHGGGVRLRWRMA